MATDYNLYGRNHYEKNKDYYRQRNKDRKERIRKFLIEYKTGKPCMDCGQTYPHYVMDFDHRGDKKFNVSHSINAQYSFKKIQQEIDKCDLICSNCHRVRTHAPGSFNGRTDGFDPSN